MAMQLSQYTVISLAENATALYRSVLPVWQGVTVTRGLKSITIPDGVNVAPVIGNITIPGGVSHCNATCEEQSRLSVWGCLYTSRSLPNVISY